MRTSHYLSNTSRNADRLVTFHQQMADFARGQRLRALRDERHLSQEDAAHEIGVTTKALRAWEKGGKIKWENAKSAGAFYGVDPESLVSREVGSIPGVPGAEKSQLDRIEETLNAVLAELATTQDAVVGLDARLTKELRAIARKLNTSAKVTQKQRGG